MRSIGINGKAAMFGLALALGAVSATGSAQARPHHGAYASHGSIRAHLASRFGYSYGSGGLQCVPFARENTGIELSGNAATWWSGADGVYQRGAHPEVGSVLNFRANGRMRMGHVAVVSNVVDSRNIQIDHANWGGPGGARGGVSRNISVVDVSPGNDWTAVRVALGHSGDFGSIYPTFGFIYDRPDSGTRVANNGTAPTPVLNTPPRDLRPAADRVDMASLQADDEVAEAPDDAPVARTRHARYEFAGRTARFARSERVKGHGSSRYARNEGHDRGMARETTRYAARGASIRPTVTRVQSREAPASHSGHRHRL